MSDVKKINERLSVATQIRCSELRDIANQGYKTIINNRPDNEEPNQPTSESLAKDAKRFGLAYFPLPVTGDNITDDQVEQFDNIVENQNGPVLAFCRTGTRCASLWALSEADNSTTESILKTAQRAGYDLAALKPRIDERRAHTPANPSNSETHDILIVGGGSAGIATAASLLKRHRDLKIAIIEPSSVNYYQPGWTMVGGGIFGAEKTVRDTKTLIPKNTKWIQGRVLSFDPERNAVVLEDGRQIGYAHLVVAAGLQLDIDKIEGLEQSIGKYGVTTNYQFHLAPYTWQLIRNMSRGTAIFTQPPMPIKCAGAPQKVMYLACDFWRKTKRLKGINVHFCSAGEGIFGIKDYVPTLMKYIKKYGIYVSYQETLVAINGPSGTAWFDRVDTDGNLRRVSRQFDIIHVTPPQSAPDFIKNSSLANEEGWVDVDKKTLKHRRFENIYAVGDCGSMPNAKTMAAARKQAPIVATNLLADINARDEHAEYDGYGSCPLTVEHGKIALTEFGYDGRLLPTFPLWMIDGTKPSRLAWWLKVKIMPLVYWRLMLNGREWLAKPKLTKDKTLGL